MTYTPEQLKSDIKILFTKDAATVSSRVAEALANSAIEGGELLRVYEEELPRQAVETMRSIVEHPKFKGPLTPEQEATILENVTAHPTSSYGSEQTRIQEQLDEIEGRLALAQPGSQEEFYLERIQREMAQSFTEIEQVLAEPYIPSTEDLIEPYAFECMKHFLRAAMLAPLPSIGTLLYSVKALGFDASVQEQLRSDTVKDPSKNRLLGSMIQVMRSDQAAYQRIYDALAERRNNSQTVAAETSSPSY